MTQSSAVPPDSHVGRLFDCAYAICLWTRLRSCELAVCYPTLKLGGPMSGNQQTSGEFLETLGQTLQRAWLPTIGLLMLAVAALVLPWIVLPYLHLGDSTWYAYLFGLSANLMSAVFLYYFLERRIRSINEANQTLGFDFPGFIKQTKRASRRVYILEVWTQLLNNDAYRKKFLEAVTLAAKKGARIRLLLLHPESEAAAQRESQLKDIDVVDEIRENLAYLFSMLSNPVYHELDGPMEVKVFRALPPAIMYLCDDSGSLSLFSLDKITSDRPNLDINLYSPLGDYARSKFDEYWNGSETNKSVKLEDHMTLRFTAAAEETFHYATAANGKFWYLASRRGQSLRKILESPP